jgi:hypothetical protein
MQKPVPSVETGFVNVFQVTSTPEEVVLLFGDGQPRGEDPEEFTARDMKAGKKNIIRAGATTARGTERATAKSSNSREFHDGGQKQQTSVQSG